MKSVHNFAEDKARKDAETISLSFDVCRKVGEISISNSLTGFIIDLEDMKRKRVSLDDDSLRRYLLSLLSHIKEKIDSTYYSDVYQSVLSVATQKAKYN